MTTLAKIEANRLNGQLSTGPRTAEGKAAVARNATKHGIFSSVPVLPGECPEEWEAHRAGVVESLAPVGLLEVNLAERAALLLWRLQRLARYEAETVAAAMEEVEVPALPEPPDQFPPLFPKPAAKTREDQLRDLRAELRAARRELAGVVPAREFFASELADDAAVPSAAAECLLEAACGRAETADGLRADPPRFGGKTFLRKLGVAGDDPGAVTWTVGLVRRGLLLYAGYAGEAAEEFIQEVRADLEESVEEQGRRVRRLERDAGAVEWLLEGRAARSQSWKLLPGDGRDERIAKYERHLHSLLTSTLHELERLQARREGEIVPPPVVADVNVTVDTGPS
jgi:hypothetical protein